MRRTARRTLVLAIAALAVLALTLAACSDDGGADGDDAWYGETEDAPAAGSTTASVASAPALAADGGGYGGEGGGAANLLGRTIIRDGYVALEVASVAEAFEAVRAIASAHGGYVADSSLSGAASAAREFGPGEPGRASAHLTLRVPADRFDRAIADLRALALTVVTVSTSTRDVTGEVTDLASDLRNLRAVEAQYLELLGRADEVGDVVLVYDRLTQTRGQIERIEGSLALLEELADLSTLRVQLDERSPDAPTGGDGLLDAARGGWESSLVVLNGLARGALAAAAFSWWLVPVVVVALAVLYRRGLPRRRGGGMDTPEDSA